MSDESKDSEKRALEVVICDLFFCRFHYEKMAITVYGTINMDATKLLKKIIVCGD